jgi:hypothetical protein
VCPQPAGRPNEDGCSVTAVFVASARCLPAAAKCNTAGSRHCITARCAGGSDSSGSSLGPAQAVGPHTGENAGDVGALFFGTSRADFRG